MNARETLHSDLLTTPAAQKLPQPEGWASTRIKRYRDEVRTETLAEVAEMLDRVGHPAAALVLRYADEAAGPEEKTTPAGAAVTPQPEQSGEWAAAAVLRDRLADLLAHIRKHPGRTWTTENVRRFYLSQAPKRATCRRDLQSLRAMGWLVEHDEKGRRFYRLTTRKDGQR
ncbi:hypothetical protein CU044_2136 [Streptomyces sp. L-9-10]|uniref:hypothetical protein n=1 Tax=Streptomyces sp. L-9-10 TaxID=1478131 RepID=UPI00101C57D7|nr:hypothetical protein [Streptomyces sp. L-9-10]RYJ29395.1 hypothetical protein CU044_2136 [Streptomyces sp. L-9-10]